MPRVKKIAALLIAGHEPRRRIAHRLKAGQLEREVGGEFLARGAVIRRIGRQEQTRFEKGEPCGHHQIIGGQFNAQRRGLFDKGEVLQRQLQDRHLT